MISIERFQDQVWKVEGIRLIVRGSQNDQVGEYNYPSAVDDNWSVDEWLKYRVLDCIGEYEVVVIQDDGVNANGSTPIRNVRWLRKS